MRYFRPNSLGWWSGVFMIVMGILQAAGVIETLAERSPEAGGVIAALTRAIVMIAGTGGDMTPAALIGSGFAAIGIRDAIERHRIHMEMSAEERHFEAISFMEAQQLSLKPGEFGSDEDDMSEFSYWPEDEDPLPPGVRDPYGPGGTRE